MASMVNNRRGRPPGGSDARDRLLAAARCQFFSRGYAGTTIRSVAAEAGVNPALINYHFGSKEGLFNAVLDLVVSPGRVIDHVAAHGPDRFAVRLLDTALRLWDAPHVQSQVRTVVAAFHSESATRDLFRGYVETQVITRLADAVGGPGARERASAAAAVMVGAFLTRYVLQIQPLAGMSRSEAVRYLTPPLQSSLTPRPARGR